MASGQLIKHQRKKSQKHIPPIVENLKEQHSLFSRTTLLLQAWHYFGFHKLEMADSVDLRRLNHNFIRMDRFFFFPIIL